MGIFKRQGEAATAGSEHPFPPALLEQARSTPGGWVYEIDPTYAAEGADGAVPPEGIKGAWEVGPDGLPTGVYRSNGRYSG